MLRPILRTRVTFGYKHKIATRGGTWWYVVGRGGGAKPMDSFTSCFAQIVPFFVFPSLCSLRLQAGRTQHVLGTQRVQHFELKKEENTRNFLFNF